MSKKNYIEVVEQDNNEDSSADPVIYTKVTKSACGAKILAKTVSWRRGMPETKYGFIQEQIPYEQSDLARGGSHDPADYKKHFQPMPKTQVFRVKRLNEKGKKNLATILRTEFAVNGKIEFLN